MSPSPSPPGAASTTGSAESESESSDDSTVEVALPLELDEAEASDEFVASDPETAVEAPQGPSPEDPGLDAAADMATDDLVAEAAAPEAPAAPYDGASSPPPNGSGRYEPAPYVPGQYAAYEARSSNGAHQNLPPDVPLDPVFEAFPADTALPTDQPYAPPQPYAADQPYQSNQAFPPDQPYPADPAYQPFPTDQSFQADPAFPADQPYDAYPPSVPFQGTPPEAAYGALHLDPPDPAMTGVMAPPMPPMPVVVPAPAPAVERKRAVRSVSRPPKTWGSSRKGRRVKRVVRRIELWSVLKVSILLYACIYGVTLLAGVLLWGFAYSAGLIDNFESFMRDIGFDDFRFFGDQLFREAAVIGGVLVVAGALLTVLCVALVNLISEVTGGIRFVVIEIDTEERPSARPQ